MKAGVIRDLAAAHDRAALESAADAIAEEIAPPFPVDGEDDGERLTHLMLAARIRQRMEERGEDLKVAFRAVMGGVREVMTNRVEGD